MTRWRYITPTKRGRWYDTKEAAQDAAVKAGLGSRDDWPPHRFYPNPFTEIEADENNVT